MEGLESQGIELRRAAANDDDLIRRTLSLAAHWRDHVPANTIEGIGAAYHEHWGRPDDVGVLAFAGIEFAGGAYARRVGPADGTYGYVAADLHELTMGIEPSHRGQGLGRLLLETLKARVLERQLGGLSLSVELDNAAARKLYVATKFETVEERSTDVLMAWRPGRISPGSK